MRYVSLIFFAMFLVFCVDFATQNTEQVILSYKIEWLNFIFKTERPVFVPIFFSFAFGIIFSVIYFFIYHAILLRKLRLKKKEIKRLEGLFESEKNKQSSIKKHNLELQQSTDNVHSNLDYNDDHESLILEEVETEKFKK